jgi:uncharacterized protein
MRLVGATLAVLATAAATLPGADPSPSPVVIPQAEQFDVTSKAGPVFRIFLAAPRGKAPGAGHPVIYLSDGNGNFPTVHAAVRRQSTGDLAAVVVGIGYPTDDARAHAERRSFDLTPPASEEWMKRFPKGGSVVKTGGNDQFLAFIEGELKPLIEKRHAIDRTRQALFGHSLGGLFALHVLFTKPGAFQTYVASSPSIWWNDRSVLVEEKAFAGAFAGKAVNARLLVTAGEWEREPGPGVPKARAEVIREQRLADDAKDLAGRLAKSPVKGLVVAFREFAEEDHGSVVLPAASRGVRFALEAP